MISEIGSSSNYYLIVNVPVVPIMGSHILPFITTKYIDSDRDFGCNGTRSTMNDNSTSISNSTIS